MTGVSKKSRPVLVLLHGWGLNHAVWQQLVSAIAPTIDVLALDLPGYGGKQHYPSKYSLSDVAAQLAEQIPSQSMLLGWSLGGLIATRIALDYPEKVKALAWVGSSPCFLAKPEWPGMSPQVMTQFATALSQDLKLTVERFLAIQAMGSETARQDIKVLKQAILALPLPDANVLAAGLRLLEQEDLRAQLPQLSMPVAGCFGRLDSLVPVAITDLLLQWLPQAKFTILGKASHAPFISHPAEFLQWLQAWLRTELRSEPAM